MGEFLRNLRYSDPFFLCTSFKNNTSKMKNVVFCISVKIFWRRFSRLNPSSPAQKMDKIFQRKSQFELSEKNFCNSTGRPWRFKLNFFRYFFSFSLIFSSNSMFLSGGRARIFRFSGWGRLIKRKWFHWLLVSKRAMRLIILLLLLCEIWF